MATLGAAAIDIVIALVRWVWGGFDRAGANGPIEGAWRVVTALLILGVLGSGIVIYLAIGSWNETHDRAFATQKDQLAEIQKVEISIQDELANLAGKLDVAAEHDRAREGRVKEVERQVRTVTADLYNSKDGISPRLARLETWKEDTYPPLTATPRVKNPPHKRQPKGATQGRAMP